MAFDHDRLMNVLRESSTGVLQQVSTILAERSGLMTKLSADPIINEAGADRLLSASVEIIKERGETPRIFSRRSEHQQRVDEFMRKAGQDVPESPIDPGPEVRKLRATIILEEAIETITALGVRIFVRRGKDEIDLHSEDFEIHVSGEFNPVEVIDGCCDLRVVTTGTLSACGIADEAPQREVDESNLRKFEGDAHRREDGKWVKPSNWQPPNLSQFLTGT